MFACTYAGHTWMTLWLYITAPAANTESTVIMTHAVHAPEVRTAIPKVNTVARTMRRGVRRCWLRANQL